MRGWMHQKIVNVFACILAFGAGDEIPLNEFPFIMAHDAGSGYLQQVKRPAKELVIGWTQTQPVGLFGQLDCGARAFDARPAVDDSGMLVWHHGPITVEHSFSSSLQEVVEWCAQNPSELVLVTVWDCVGVGCDAAVAAAFADAGIFPLTDCASFRGLTVSAARALAQLPGGGLLLAVTAPAPSDGEPACSFQNYEPSNACSGFSTDAVDERSTSEAEAEAALACLQDHGEPVDGASDNHGHDARIGSIRSCADKVAAALRNEATEDSSSAARVGSERTTRGGGSVSSAHGVYRCYDGDASADIPLGRMFAYLDGVSAGFPNSTAGSGSGQLWQMQALWQETPASVVLGTLARSTLLQDEARSGLNAKVADAVSAGRWRHINLLEVNNVCDGGPALFDALRKRWNETTAA